MKWPLLSMLTILGQFTGHNGSISPRNLIPANNPHIQYLGRWDLTDPLHPKHAWPGVRICMEFSGTSIGVRMADSDHYYNVYVDGKFHRHRNQSGNSSS
jgi:hypothetical protein